MKKDAACGLFVLVFDAFLGAALWVIPLLLRCPCPGLGAMWAFGAAKWLCLHVYARALTDGHPPPAVRRLVALLCLLAPTLESGRALLAGPVDPYTGPRPDLSALVLAPVAAALACVVWDLGLSGSRKAARGDLPENGRQLLIRMLKYFKPDTFYLVAAFFFLLLGVLCDSFIPKFLGEVIDMLRAPGLHFTSALTRLVLLSVGSAVFSSVRGGIFMCTLGRLNKRLKHLLFQRLLQQEVQFFQDNNPGHLSARLHADVDRMGRTVALNANAAVRSSFKVVLMLALMMQQSWELTLLTFIEMPLLTIVQNKYNNLKRELKDQIQDCLAHSQDLASQVVSGIRTVRSCSAEEHELRRYRHAVEQMGAIRGRYRVYGIVFGLVRRLISLVIKLVMLVQAGSLASCGQLSVGSLVSFFLYQKPMMASLRELLYCHGETVSTVGVIAKVFGYLDRTSVCQPEGTLAPARLEGGIVFQDVTLRYPSCPEPALKSISVELRAGKVTALVGPSGSGKTSFVSLLKRLYEPTEGRILLDGAPLHHYRLKYLQQKVALVSQNPVLFSGSRRYNIEYGLTDCGEEAALEAARKIGALDLVSDMEDGGDADVGERGATLADSQRQSIAVARVLVRDPQVIILDEATSKLDVEAQHATLRAVLTRGRTVLVVTHQLRTAEEADHIMFLEDGAVVEEGTHQELMARRGRYHRMKEELFSQGTERRR